MSSAHFTRVPLNSKQRMIGYSPKQNKYSTSHRFARILRESPFAHLNPIMYAGEPGEAMFVFTIALLNCTNKRFLIAD